MIEVNVCVYIMFSCLFTACRSACDYFHHGHMRDILSTHIFYHWVGLNCLYPLVFFYFTSLTGLTPGTIG